MSKLLVQYLRSEQKEPYGCVIALDRNKIGWSLCHPLDQFSKDMGKKIAIERAKKEPHYKSFVRHLGKASGNNFNGDHPKDLFYKHIPEEGRHLRMEDIRIALFYMEDRADKYFKKE